MSDFFERVAAQTLAITPVVRGRREPLFRTSVRPESDALADDTSDDASLENKFRSQRRARVAANALAESSKAGSSPIHADWSDERTQRTSTQTVVTELDRQPVGERECKVSAGSNEPELREISNRPDEGSDGSAVSSITSNAQNYVDVNDSQSRGIEPPVHDEASRRDDVTASDAGDRRERRIGDRNIGAVESLDSRGVDEPAIDVDMIAVTSCRANAGKSHAGASSFPARVVEARLNDPVPDQAPVTREGSSDDDALTINVSIGRIDIVRPTPASLPTPVARPSQPRPSLGDYMRLREKVRGR
ncbi:MAG: hypothetical protein NVS4B5_15620 [Vulcanimicrobiaceae bacterium]